MNTLTDEHVTFYLIKRNARTFFAGARLLATVVFFAVVFFATGAALALPARTFLGAGAGALDLVAAVAFLAGAGLGVVLDAETGLAFALAAGLVLEAGLDLEAGLGVGLF